jgi:hypothetical protein
MLYDVAYFRGGNYSIWSGHLPDSVRKK